MAKRCRNGRCSYPRATWWKQALGVDYSGGNQGGGGDTFYVTSDGDGVGTQADPFGPTEFVTALGDGTITEGSTVYFKRGDTFVMGDIDIEVDSLTFDAYGEGDDPVIIGSEDISGLTWTNEGDGIYSTDMATAPEWIFLNGVASKWAQTEWLDVAATPANNQITVTPADLSSYTGVVGSKCRVFEAHFRISSELTVTDYNSGTGVITFDTTYADVGASNYFALFDHLEYLTENDSWYYDSVNEKLYYKSASDPSTLDLRASTHHKGFILTANGISFKNLTLKHYKYGIYSETGNTASVVVDGCTFNDIKLEAINLYDATNCQIKNSTFQRIGVNGFSMDGEADTTNTIVTGNYFESIGMDSNYPLTEGSVKRNGNGFIVTGAGCMVSENEVENTAYNGMLCNGYTGITVEKNIVHNVLRRFRDGAGIYTSGNSVVINNDDGIIRNNIIYDIASTTIDGLTTEDTTPAIYLDSRTRRCLVTGNIIYNVARYGVLCNRNTDSNSITNNIIRAQVCIRFRHDAIGGTAPIIYPNADGHTVTGNILAMTTTSSSCLDADDWNAGDTYDPFANGGGCDNNYYINPYGTTIARYKGSTGSFIPYDLAGWQARMGYDAGSTEITDYISSSGYSDRDLLVITNETASSVNGTAPANFQDVDGNAVTNYTIAAYSGLLLLAQPSSANSIQFASASSQYVNFGTTADIQFERTDPFSIAFFFKIASAPASAQLLLSNFQESPARGYRVVVTAGGKISIELRNTTTTNRYTATDNGSSHADNVWHHCLIIKPATHADTKIYIDGVDQGVSESDNLNATIVSTEDLVLAAQVPFNAAFLDGLIDELAIWDSDQTANIAEIFAGGMTRDYTELDQPPLHYWKLGDNGYVDSGTSANKLNGTAVNNPTISTDVP